MFCTHLKRKVIPNHRLCFQQISWRQKELLVDKLPTSCHFPIFERCHNMGVMNNKTTEHIFTCFATLFCIVGNNANDFIIITFCYKIAGLVVMLYCSIFTQYKYIIFLIKYKYIILKIKYKYIILQINGIFILYFYGCGVWVHQIIIASP